MAVDGRLGRWRLSAAALLLLSLVGCTVVAGRDGDEQPRVDAETQPLAPGDRLQVDVRGQPDLAGTHELDLDGTIELPLIGRIDAYRHTAAGLQDAVRAAYADGFLRAPEVTVTVLSHRPFFVSGDVARPGSYPYEPGMTVEAAVSGAGGAVPAATGATVRVLRQGGAIALPGDAPLAPGDIIELGERAG